MVDCTDSSPLSQMFVDNPFKCLSPKNPHMQKMQQRLETFQSPNWPRDRIASSPYEFAMAGFYYLGDVTVLNVTIVTEVCKTEKRMMSFPTNTPNGTLFANIY